MTQQNKEQKTGRFRLLLNDDGTHRNLWMIKFTKAQGFLIAGTSLFILCGLIYILIAFTPIRTFIPGYPDSQTRRTAIQNAIKIDSLEAALYKWTLYSENIRRVLEGKETIRIDSLIKYKSDSTSYIDPLTITRKDSILRNTVVKEEQFNISGGQTRVLPLEGLLFFPPIEGVVTQGYNEHIHPFIDIAAKEKSPVVATLDGTVIFAGWDEDTGYTIQLQHNGDIVSIYRHNQKLLKKPGDKVKAGTAIALTGDTGKISTGIHLHFELWYKGKAIDPTKYMNF